MAVTCRSSPEESLMFCDITRARDLDETTAMFEQMATDPQLGKGWGILVDARGPEGTPSVEGVEKLVETLEAVRGELTGPIAFVMGGRALFGVARMLEIRAALVGIPVRAFLHETEAREWLEKGGPGVPAAALPGSRRGVEGDIAEMLGLAKGILADGVVTESEAVMLQRWMKEHPRVVAGWPGNVLSRRLRKILQDGVATAEECEDLGQLLRQLVSGQIAVVRGGAIALPLDDPRPKVEVAARTFVLAGRFAFGPRPVCDEAIRQGGGRCEQTITERTDYFVIGTFGSRDWIRSDWGRDVATAVEYRRRFGRPHIIDEDHWATSL